jgi:antitoxin (DNA-binding transcriptional repressor) of toxin-antitoxin stability system
MKTATTQQVPQRWTEILGWVADGEEVELTDHDQVVARLTPPIANSRPKFLERAHAIWGEEPAGTLLSEIVSESRGGDRDLP